MTDLPFLPLIQNAALLLGFAGIYEVASAHRTLARDRLGLVLLGLLVGSVGVMIMLTPWVFSPGIVFDTRSVLLAVSGLVFGGIPTLIAMAMTAALRLSQGGAAAGVGVAVIIASGLIGIAWRRLRGGRLSAIPIRELYALGIAVHVVMLVLMLTLPWDTAARVLRAIAVPVIVINPAATAALGGLLLGSLRREDADAALRSSEERLRLALKAAGQGIYDHDLRTGQARVSDDYARRLGHDPGTFHETHADGLNRLHPDDRERVETAYADYVAGRRSSYRAEFRQRMADGTWRWILSVGEIVERDPHGVPVRMLGTHTDITSLRLAEEQARAAEAAMARLLREASASRRALLSIVEDLRASDLELHETVDRYQGLVGHAPDAILIDRDDRIVLANDAAVALFGAVGGQDLVGRNPYQLFHPEDHAEVRERIRSLRDTAVVDAPVERRIIRDDGSEVDVEVASAPFEDHGSVSIHFILRDITKRKQAEAALHRLTEELEERVRDRTAKLEVANGELEAYTRSVSHDLRAPLRAISGFSQILVSRHADVLDDEGRHFLDNIVVASGQMEQLIEDLLAYSRLGREAARSEPVALEPIVARLRRTFERQLTDPDTCLDADGLAATPLGDPTLVEQALLNLVSNALTYHRDGVGPRVAIDSRRDDGQVIISVADNGLGIEAQDHERVFDVFTRLHTEAAFAGTGIGLAIARKAARAMGGDIHLDSTPGSGSTFSLHLPAAEDGGSRHGRRPGRTGAPRGASPPSTSPS